MKNDNIDPQVFSRLEELKPVAARQSRAAMRGRARFLAEAVSLRSQRRHSGWMIFPYKEKFAMNIVISLLVVVGLLFGGSATVSAARDDLPNQPLYHVKLISEDLQLWFTSDPVQQIRLLMAQEQNRLQEMQQLAADGIVPPADVAVQAQQRIQRALQVARQLDEASRLAILEQIRTRLQTQEQQMLQLEQGPCAECVPVLRQTREMLQLHLGELGNGLADPDALQNETRQQTQNQDQLRIYQTPWAAGTAVPPCETCTPALDGTGQQNGDGSPSVATPMQQQNQTQQQGGGGTQNGQGPGGGDGSPNGAGGGSSTGSGGQGGKP